MNSLADSLIPKSKTGKTLTVGTLLLAILGFLSELRVSVGNIDTRLTNIEKKLDTADKVEHLSKIFAKGYNDAP